MMSELKKEWKVVDGYYPGFLKIIGASYPVSIVISASDLSLEGLISRTNDAHLMAAAPDLLEALEECVDELNKYRTTSHPEGHIGARDYLVKLMHARAAIAKARGQS